MNNFSKIENKYFFPEKKCFQFIISPEFHLKPNGAGSLKDFCVNKLKLGHNIEQKILDPFLRKIHILQNMA